MAKMLWPTITREQFWFGKEGQPDCLVGMPYDLPDSCRLKWEDEDLNVEGTAVPHFKAVLPENAIGHVAWGRNDAHYHDRSVPEAPEISEAELMEKLSRLMQEQQEEEAKSEKEANEWFTSYASAGTTIPEEC